MTVFNQMDSEQLVSIKPPSSWPTAIKFSTAEKYYRVPANGQLDIEVTLDIDKPNELAYASHYSGHYFDKLRVEYAGGGVYVPLIFKKATTLKISSNVPSGTLIRVVDKERGFVYEGGLEGIDGALVSTEAMVPPGQLDILLYYAFLKPSDFPDIEFPWVEAEGSRDVWVAAYESFTLDVQEDAELLLDRARLTRLTGVNKAVGREGESLYPRLISVGGGVAHTMFDKWGIMFNTAGGAQSDNLVYPVIGHLSDKINAKRFATLRFDQNDGNAKDNDDPSDIPGYIRWTANLDNSNHAQDRFDFDARTTPYLRMSAKHDWHPSNLSLYGFSLGTTYQAMYDFSPAVDYFVHDLADEQGSRWAFDTKAGLFDVDIDVPIIDSVG